MPPDPPRRHTLHTLCTYYITNKLYIYLLRPSCKSGGFKAGQSILKSANKLLKPAALINRWKLPTGFKASQAQFTTQHVIESKHSYYIEVPIPSTSTSSSSLAQLQARSVGEFGGFKRTTLPPGEVRFFQ